MWCAIEKQNKTKKTVPFAFSSSDFFLASTMSCAYVGCSNFHGKEDATTENDPLRSPLGKQNYAKVLNVIRKVSTHM